ncbi:MAG: hypothetical protein PQ614_10520 [Rickettsiales bacterium]|nr:hypothetical protein [Rickettsiales bacterium]
MLAIQFLQITKFSLPFLLNNSPADNLAIPSTSNVGGNNSPVRILGKFISNLSTLAFSLQTFARSNGFKNTASLDSLFRIAILHLYFYFNLPTIEGSEVHSPLELLQNNKKCTIGKSSGNFPP